ncbi:MAG: phosphatidylserine decarboxylase family protein [Gemmataceae bacterium]
MATTTTPATAVPITCVQPGGGWCVRLELAWGRWRRWWLRRFRPGYVRRMMAKRQGDCPNCPHDVIDTRDLKYFRNVCGYWFHPEDDPFRWRDRLGLARMGLVEIACVSALMLPLSLLLLVAALGWHGLFWGPWIAALVFWFELVYFFRDPRRSIPTDRRALLSPADGKVTHIEEVDDADFPNGRALRISIFLSVFNVHVNRLPRSGQVAALRYFPGGFLDARHPDCATRNEQLWLDMREPNGRLVRVKQIAGALARRIVCWSKLGETVQAGDRFGMIKFGSRTDVLIPAHDAVELLVQVGDKVHGGSTMLLRFLESG